MQRDTEIRIVQIETTQHCTRRCEFCWNHGRKTSPSDLMPMDDYRLVLDRLAEIDYKGRIHPYVQEPLCDPRFLEIVRLTRWRFPDNVIFINTNGDLLTRGYADQLFAAGMNCIQINHYDGKNANLRRDLYGLPIDHADLEELLPAMWNRAGKAKAQNIGVDHDCIQPFNKFTIMRNLDVVVCCCDIDHEVTLGNLRDSSIMDIWHGELVNKYRAAHVAKQYDALHLCRDCDLVRRKRGAYGHERNFAQNGFQAQSTGNYRVGGLGAGHDGSGCLS